MNTERLAVLLLGLMLLACSTSEDGPSQPPESNEGVQTNYSLLVSTGSTVSSTAFKANALEINEMIQTGGLDPLAIPNFTYRDASTFSFLRQEPDCRAVVHLWDATSDTKGSIEVFQEEPGCERQITSLAHSPTRIFVSYGRPGEVPKEQEYFIKSLLKSENQSEVVEIPLQKEPLQVFWSSDRIFVLTFDIADGKNSLLVLDDALGQLINEIELGTNVLKMFKNSAGDLLVSYQDRHLLIDDSSLETVSRVVYTKGKEPHFGRSAEGYFDPAGTLYYAMPTDLNSTEYEHIPGVYDFDSHTAFLYYFENFLTVERRALYDLGDTRALGYDHHNGLILIGYSKLNNPSKGGLLRIKPVPEAKFIDQIDLNAVPLHI